MHSALAARRTVPPAPSWRSAAFALAAAAALQPAFAGPALGPDTVFYVDPTSSTLRASAGLGGPARADAQILGSFPSASWFTSGTPAQVQANVQRLVEAAAAQKAVPTVVAYNLPFRDCQQYSAGGAANLADYKAWIDGLAAGIGNRKAVIIVEPDGLGIIPHNIDINGNREWCQPAESDPATAASERYEALNYAVDRLKANPNAEVYLDGTHSAWLGVGDIASRLVRAGVRRADGFYLNASNYESTPRGRSYGTWISQCIHYANNAAEGGWRLGRYTDCASQYYPATPADFSTWVLSDQWYETNVTQAANPPSGPAALTHFVIDTSRNGQGAWTPPAGNGWPDAQAWCNPPDRGIGERPTTRTGHPLVNAYLWIKVPGESDGQCDRGTGTGQDPARGYADPAAGAWFVQQAAELVALAQPPVARPVCEVQYIVHGTWPNGFNTQVWIKNTGTQPINGWTLGWSFSGGQEIDHAWSVNTARTGPAYRASNLSWNRTIAPGASLTFGFIGKGDGATSAPLLFTLNGAACTTR